jgi:predicted anti-sigma-YlaC factor YlaD
MMAKTTCDWTVERLPWWVNGTLEGAEAESVEAHLAECSACRDELAATRGALALYGAHLPIETLLDLVEGEAGEREARDSGRGAGGAVLSSEAVAAHLGHCPACREQLALLRESREAVEEESAAGEPTGAKVTPFAPRRAQTAPPLRRRRLDHRRLDHRRLDRRSLALAASLLFCVVAAGGWLSSGLTAERRGDTIAELRRLAEATAARDEEAPSGAAPTEVAADEASAALAAENAELKAERDRLRQELADGERVAGGVGVGVTVPWHVQPTVMRNAEARPDEEPIEVPAGQEQLSLYLTGLGDEPLTLVVDDAAGGRILERSGLTAVEAAGIDPHRTVTLPLADLPDGELLTLRLLADGEVIATLLLRIVP